MAIRYKERGEKIKIGYMKIWRNDIEWRWDEERECLFQRNENNKRKERILEREGSEEVRN